MAHLSQECARGAGWCLLVWNPHNVAVLYPIILKDPFSVNGVPIFPRQCFVHADMLEYLRCCPEHAPRRFPACRSDLPSPPTDKSMALVTSKDGCHVRPFSAAFLLPWTLLRPVLRAQTMICTICPPLSLPEVHALAFGRSMNELPSFTWLVLPGVTPIGPQNSRSMFRRGCLMRGALVPLVHRH